MMTLDWTCPTIVDALWDRLRCDMWADLVDSDARHFTTLRAIGVVCRSMSGVRISLNVHRARVYDTAMRTLMRNFTTTISPNAVLAGGCAAWMYASTQGKDMRWWRPRDIDIFLPANDRTGCHKVHRIYVAFLYYMDSHWSTRNSLKYRIHQGAYRRIDDNIVLRVGEFYTGATISSDASSIEPLDDTDAMWDDAHPLRHALYTRASMEPRFVGYHVHVLDALLAAAPQRPYRMHIMDTWRLRLRSHISTQSWQILPNELNIVFTDVPTPSARTPTYVEHVIDNFDMIQCAVGARVFDGKWKFCMNNASKDAIANMKLGFATRMTQSVFCARKTMERVSKYIGYGFGV